jgi:hypothetical protein
MLIKNRRIDDEVRRRRNAARNEWAAARRRKYLLGKKCAVCNRHYATEVHHIAGRNAAAREQVFLRYEDPRNWLAVCGQFQLGCHERIDKESPALWVCAAKLQLKELDLEFLRELRQGRRFAFDFDELHQALDDIEQWRKSLGRS